MQRGKKGFTLIELMVVIAIIGILSAIAVPNLSAAIEAYELRAAAGDLSALLFKARSLAIKEKRPITIKFELSSPGQSSDGRYVFDAESTHSKIIPECGSLSRKYSGVHFGFGKAKKGASSTGKLPAAPLSFVGHKIEFNSLGVCTSGYVYLANGNGSAIAIGTNSTGVIKHKQWNGSHWD